ncbi:hypothetical protein Fmac_025153 [Flemingia macrophylla]|uniref:Uncharacterized protein n=1 Tax=Flemingia macrophylla TaxID=520843 RepID=A0ABD1LRF4_9FABA
MKLGVNHKTGHRWLLRSGLTKPVDAPGAFSLEWEPIGQELMMRRRGKVCWRSGKLRNNRFEHISEDAQRMLRYSIVSNGDEDSFSFTTNEETKFWFMAYNGKLSDDKGDVAMADLCFGYNNTDGGCQRWMDIPKCRKPGDVFLKKIGYVSYQKLTSEPNTSYGYSDCEARYWSSCTCHGFKKFYSNGTGCYFFHVINSSAVNNFFDGSGPSCYWLENVPTSSQQKSTKKLKWIGAVVLSVLLIICLISMFLVVKKRKYAIQGKKRKAMVMKMLRLSTCCNRSTGNFTNRSRSCCEKTFKDIWPRNP